MKCFVLGAKQMLGYEFYGERREQREFRFKLN